MGEPNNRSKVNQERLDEYISRIGPIWSLMCAEAGLSRQPVCGLPHLATALLLNEQVGEVLAPVKLPSGHDIRSALTGAEPPEEQLRKWGIRHGPNFVGLPATQWYVGDKVYDCVDAALGGNSLEGLEAHLRLLEYAIRDEEVRARLNRVLNVDQLERVLRDALA